MIRANAWSVVFIDPLYLCLLVGESDSDAANKLHRMGALLDQLCRACRELGCTPILLHHSVKSLGSSRNTEPLELTDVHGAGIAEFMRQWILISRREPHQDGGALDRVWLRVGGSAGHSALWALDVDQGQFNAAERRREHWRVAVMSAEQARLGRASRRDAARQDARDQDLERRLLDVLSRHPDGIGITNLVTEAGVGHDHNLARAALDRMIATGSVERFRERRQAGSAPRMLDLFRLPPDSTRIRSDPDAQSESAIEMPDSTEMGFDPEPPSERAIELDDHDSGCRP